MFEWLPPAAGEWTAGAILAAVVWMILTDRLVTRKRLEEAREEATLWRAGFTTQQEINREHAIANSKQADALKDHAESALLQQKVVQAIQEKHLQGGG